MKLNEKMLIILVGALFALGFALYSQFVDGYHPCDLCIKQRLAYIAVAWFSIGTLLSKTGGYGLTKTPAKQVGAIFVSIFLAVEVAVAIYHTGIEQHWWQGFTACSSSVKSGQSLDDIKAKLMGTPLVRCDEATWYFLKLSMAGWNAIYASALFIFSLIPCRKFS